jgi:hypothetical protein
VLLGFQSKRNHHLDPEDGRNPLKKAFSGSIVTKMREFNSTRAWGGPDLRLSGTNFRSLASRLRVPQGVRFYQG